MKFGKVIERVKQVDISPLLASLDALPFVAVNIGSTNPTKSPCFVVPPKHPVPTAVTEFVDGLGLGGETARILFRKLAPHQGMPPHVDAWMPTETNWRRFQIPLVSHPEIKMRWPDDGVEEHLEPGYLYEVCFDRTHEVVNNTDHSRVHLQIDQVNATI